MENNEKLHPALKLDELIDNELTSFIRTLEGRVMTQVESMFSDKIQRESAKSVFRNLIYDVFRETYWNIISYLDGFLKAQKIKRVVAKAVSEYWKDKSHLFE